MSDLLICVNRQDFPALIPQSFYLPTSAPVLSCGPVEVLHRPKIAILNSRQSPRFTRSSAWVQQTLKVLDQHSPQELTVVSSTGTPAWDFTTWAAGQRGFGIVLVFPAGSAQNFNVLRTKTAMDLGLNSDQVLALRPIRIGGKKSSPNDQIVRDRWVLALSDRLVPISLRPKGNLEALFGDNRLPPEVVDRRFQISFSGGSPHKDTSPSINIQLSENFDFSNYLIHWTRSWIGPYPGETQATMFKRRLESSTDPFNGLETLRHILQEGVIRASTRLIRGGFPVVPFTERSPEDLPSLTQWCSGLRRWTFEPYGLALSKAKLQELGARPVIYGEAEAYDDLSEADKPFFQITKSGWSDWRREKEWRVIADVRLNSFSEEDLLILVRAKAEVRVISSTYNRKVISLTGEN